MCSGAADADFSCIPGAILDCHNGAEAGCEMPDFQTCMRPVQGRGPRGPRSGQVSCSLSFAPGTAVRTKGPVQACYTEAAAARKQEAVAAAD